MKLRLPKDNMKNPEEQPRDFFVVIQPYLRASAVG